VKSAKNQFFYKKTDEYDFCFKKNTDICNRKLQLSESRTMLASVMPSVSNLDKIKIRQNCTTFFLID